MIQDILEQAEKKANQVIEEAKSQGVEEPVLAQAGLIPIEAFVEIISRVLRSMRLAPDRELQRIISSVRYRMAYWLKMFVEDIKANEEPRDSLIYGVGLLMGQFGMLELFALDPKMKSIGQSQAQTERWYRRKEKEKKAIAKVISEARDLFERGHNHVQVTDIIWDRNKELQKELLGNYEKPSKGILRKAMKEIAPNGQVCGKKKAPH